MSIDRIILAGVVFLLAAALAFSEFSRLGQSKNVEQLETRLDIAESDASAALEAIIPPSLLANAEQSVYLVIANNQHNGSAFVLDRDKGILVTAAHVASDFDFNDPEQEYSIINRHSGKPLRIRAAQVHAGFDVFRSIVAAYQPIDPESSIFSPRHKRIIDIADDAALLFVDPIDPETGENLLGPALALASEEKLAALSSGDPIAVIGYPIDTITSNILLDSAAARVERGVIATMLSPIDLVEDAGDSVTQNLIVHRMAAAPGNSGGPILNRDSEIIGISSHGHDSRHSNGDSLAQRADVIYDMITPFREQDGLERTYIPDWNKRLGKWPKAADILPYSSYRLFAKIDGERMPRSTKIGELEIVEDPPFTATTFAPDFPDITDKFVLYAADLESEAIDETEAGDEDKNARKSRRTTVANKPVFVIEDSGAYAHYSLYFSKRQNYAIFAFDYSMAWDTAGYCPLTIFYRRKGEAVLRSTRKTRVPSVFIAKTDDGDADSNFDIIVKRGQCDAQNKEYLFGIVSWKPDDESAAAQASLVTRRGKKILASFSDNNDRLTNLIHCNIEALGDRAQCEQAIKVRNFVPAKR